MPIAIYSEQLRCGFLAREEALVPSRIHYFVASVSMLLFGYERFDECVKRLKPEPAQVALMVVVALGIHEEGSVVEHADAAYRTARGHRNLAVLPTMLVAALATAQANRNSDCRAHRSTRVAARASLPQPTHRFSHDGSHST